MFRLGNRLRQLRDRLSRQGKFFGDARGIAAVEFALLAPILISAFVGTFEISEAIIVNRKISSTASVLADLVSQEVDMSASRIADIFDATETVMSPYSADGLKIIVAAVGLDPDDGKKKVMWSRANTGGGWTEGSAPPVTIPADIDLTNQWIIVAQADFTYQAVFPVLAKEMFGSPSFEMESLVFLHPRNSATVPFN